MNTSATESIWANPLVRHLAVILLVKVALLAALWWLFFRLPEPAHAARGDIHTHIAGPVAPPVRYAECTRSADGC